MNAGFWLSSINFFNVSNTCSELSKYKIEEIADILKIYQITEIFQIEKSAAIQEISGTLGYTESAGFENPWICKIFDGKFS